MSLLRDRRALLVALGGVALAAILPFVATLHGGFVYDDRYQIADNDQLRDLRNLPGFFAADVWAAVGLPYSSYYRPLMYTTFALEFAVGGANPFVYRLVNVLLHALCAVSLLTLLRRTGASLAAATAAGLFFALHPMHAEVVAWPSARPELLVTLFGLLAAIVFAGSDPVRGPSARRFLGVGALVLLALFSKETGVLVPVLLGLVTMLRSPLSSAVGRVRAGITASFPFVALILLFMGVRGLVIDAGSVPRLVGDDALGRLPRTPADAVVRIAAIAGDYLGSMLLPIQASSFRVPTFETVRAGLAWLPVGLVAIVAAPWSAPAAWLAFAMLAAGVQSLGVPDAGYLGQRYAYLPSLGVCAFFGLALGALGLDRREPARRAVASALAGFALVGFVLLLVPRALEWKDERTLWTKAYERNPDSPAVVANYGYMLADVGRGEEALALFDRLETLDPGGWAAPYGQGNVRVALGRRREAIPWFEEAIRRSPKIPHLHQSLGFLYEDLGEFENARRVYQKALELFPDSAIGLGTLSVLEAKSGDPERALVETEAALAKRPDLAQLRINRIVLLARTGRIDEAIAASEEMARDPVLGSEGHRSLGILYDSYRPDPALALRHYEEALRLAPERHDADELHRRVATIRFRAGGGASP